MAEVEPGTRPDLQLCQRYGEQVGRFGSHHFHHLQRGAFGDLDFQAGKNSGPLALEPMDHHKRGTDGQTGRHPHPPRHFGQGAVERCPKVRLGPGQDRERFRGLPERPRTGGPDLQAGLGADHLTEATVAADDDGGIGPGRLHQGPERRREVGHVSPRPHPRGAWRVAVEVEVLYAAVAPDLFRLAGQLGAYETPPGSQAQLTQPLRPGQGAYELRVEVGVLQDRHVGRSAYALVRSWRSGRPGPPRPWSG